MQAPGPHGDRLIVASLLPSPQGGFYISPPKPQRTRLAEQSERALACLRELDNA